MMEKGNDEAEEVMKNNGEQEAPHSKETVLVQFPLLLVTWDGLIPNHSDSHTGSTTALSLCMKTFW